MFDGRTTPATGPVGIQALFERIHPDQAVQVQRIVSLALSSLDPQASPIDTKYQMKCHDGSWRWVHTRGRVVKRDAAGQPTHAMGVTMDIQQAKADEAALVTATQEIGRRQAMLELLSDSVNRSPVVAIVWSLSEGWPVDFVTQNVSQWGYDRAEFMSGGLLYESLVHPDDLPRINQEIADYLAVGQDSYDQRYRVRAASGRWIWLEDHTRIQRDASGQVTRAHGRHVDRVGQQGGAGIGVTHELGTLDLDVHFLELFFNQEHGREVAHFDVAHREGGFVFERRWRWAQGQSHAGGDRQCKANEGSQKFHLNAPGEVERNGAHWPVN